LPSNFLEENLVVKKMETKSPKKISPKKSPKAKKTQIAMEYTGETWLSRRHTQATQEEPAPKPISTTPKKVNNLLEMFRGEAMETGLLHFYNKFSYFRTNYSSY
jgi:hypothetical protein